MFINIGIAFVSVIGGLFITALIGHGVLNRGTIGTALVQLLGMSIIAYVLFQLGIVGILGLSLVVASPIIVRIISLLLMLWVSKRALSGDMGQESMWAAELVKESDEKFSEATKNLPSYELREIGIIAESKEELRDMTIERYKQYK